MINNKGSRWWESYFIRYALGTVAGIICVYFLLDTMGAETKAKWLMMPNITQAQIDTLVSSCSLSGNASACALQAQLYQDLYGFNLAQLALLAIYGLAFNYFASAPTLIWHAVRNLFSHTLIAPCLFYLFIMSIIVSIFLSVNSIPVFSYIVIFSVIIYIAIQVKYLGKIYNNKNGELIEFYRRLHKARKSNCIDVDSYRHLREHGNAFMIVPHNLTLLAVIIALHDIKNDWSLTWLALLWILPAALVYFLGHKIEAEMIHCYGDRQRSSCDSISKKDMPL